MHMVKSINILERFVIKTTQEYRYGLVQCWSVGVKDSFKISRPTLGNLKQIEGNMKQDR